MTNAFSSLPESVQAMIASVKESEYATLTRAGTPIANPLFHYYRPGNATIDIATGLAYPAKADRVRHSPKLGLLLGPQVHAYDPIAMLEAGTPDSRDLENQPVVLIQAVGAVRDQNLQANTDKYVDLFLDEHPAVGPPDWEVMKTMTNYWVRIWVECTPVRVYWWPRGDVNGTDPQVWESDLTSYPESDPNPMGVPTPRASWPAEAWQQRAAGVLEQFPQPILTTVTPDGFPTPLPTQGAQLTDQGFELQLANVPGLISSGRACLSFGALATFIGELTDDLFVVDRLIGNLPSVFQNDGEQAEIMAQRRDAELVRRGQSFPEIRRGYYQG